MKQFTEENLADAVVETVGGATDPRTKEILQSFVRHLHAFVREVEPTEEEWFKAIDFFTRTGKMCTDVRQEFILFSDVLGVTALVDAINHRYPAGATENSVLGPFFMEDRPTFPNGSDIANGMKGEPMYIASRVLDTQGSPVAGAKVDVWHSDGIGSYDVMMPDFKEPGCRGLFETNAQGYFWFRSVLPTSYPIPMDGTVGEMLKAANRSPVRPAHVHVRVNCPGFEQLTTMLFVAGDPYLDIDPVFGVKDSLVLPFEQVSSPTAPDGTTLEGDYRAIQYDFVLAGAKAAAA